MPQLKKFFFQATSNIARQNIFHSGESCKKNFLTATDNRTIYPSNLRGLNERRYMLLNILYDYRHLPSVTDHVKLKTH